ncbi:MAG TPA: hypothetical protein VFX98_07905 [Longimicrobiaceae bacterium]|nr:hypothetical protein [Longimicrobiaceae bacterium]
MTRLPAPDVPLSVIFDALDAAVAASSQGEVARQVGLTSSGLKRLLQSRRPGWGQTELKLRQWYMRHAAEVGPDERTVRAALDVLLSGVTDEAARETAIRKMLDAVERAHGKGSAPDWLVELRKRK